MGLNDTQRILANMPIANIVLLSTGGFLDFTVAPESGLYIYQFGFTVGGLAGVGAGTVDIQPILAKDHNVALAPKLTFNNLATVNTAFVQNGPGYHAGNTGSPTLAQGDVVIMSVVLNGGTSAPSGYPWILWATG